MAKTNIEKLMELKQLYETGVLTKEEMEAEKAKILGGESEPNETTETQVTPETETDFGEEESFFKKYKAYIFVALAACVGVILYFALSGGESSKPLYPDGHPIDVGEVVLQANTGSESESVAQRRDSLKLLHQLGDGLYVVFRLYIYDNDVTGTESLIGGKGVIKLTGTLDSNQKLVLYRTKDGVDAGKFEGKLSQINYAATLSEPGKEPFSLTIDVVYDEDLERLTKEVEQQLKLEEDLSHEEETIDEEYGEQ